MKVNNFEGREKIKLYYNLRRFEIAVALRSLFQGCRPNHADSLKIAEYEFSEVTLDVTVDVNFATTTIIIYSI